jgi:hypothetical protein
MGSFDSMTKPQPHAQLRHPIAILLASAALFMLCDTLIFRSGLYMNIISDRSIAGQLTYFTQYEASRKPSGKRDVLLTGDSKMQWGFSPKFFEQEEPNSHIKFDQGAIAASTLKAWYYILQMVDPGRDRYDAIVLPIAGYVVTPALLEYENRPDTGQLLAPFMSPRQWVDFISTYTDAKAKKTQILFALFVSHALATDIQDFLLHPLSRIKAAIRHDRKKDTAPVDNPGPEESIVDLRYDPVARKFISYPAHFTPFLISETFKEYVYLTDRQAKDATALNYDCTTHWAKRIAELYRGSRTKIVFIEMPHHPLRTPMETPIPSAPDVRAAIPKLDNVVIDDADDFSALDAPPYFRDLWHLNRAGQQRFTIMLGRRMEEILGE